MIRWLRPVRLIWGLCPVQAAALTQLWNPSSTEGCLAASVCALTFAMVLGVAGVWPTHTCASCKFRCNRLPVDSAKKLRWYDKADVASLTRQHVREKHLLLDTITALKKVGQLQHSSLLRCNIKDSCLGWFSQQRLSAAQQAGSMQHLPGLSQHCSVSLELVHSSCLSAKLCHYRSGMPAMVHVLCQSAYGQRVTACESSVG